MESYSVYDNFLTPDEVVRVRQSAITAGFGTWTPATGSVLKVDAFDGVGYMGDHSTVFRALHKALGYPLYPGETKFRITPKTEKPSYIHADRSSGTVSCILYLSHETDERSGTGFFRHKPSPEFIAAVRQHAASVEASGGKFHISPDAMPCYATQGGTAWGDMLQRDMKEAKLNNPQRWEMTGFVRAVFNRMLVFNSALYHARLPQEGLGDSPEDARMIWVTHATT